MKNAGRQLNNQLWAAAAVLCIALAMFAMSAVFSITGARYVTEIGGTGDIPYEIQTPYDVDSQTAFVNAINSGYSYVKLSSKLTGPIIMSGELLTLRRDLTIDLNGKEIQRTSAESLLNVTSGTKLRIVDTTSGGGLYNPVGSVISVSGGELSVQGGVFESGPRPQEYYTNLKNEVAGGAYAIGLKQETVNVLRETRSGVSGKTKTILPVRYAGYGSLNTGSVYFDTAANEIARDTYCFTVIKGSTSDDFTTFSLEEADFAYTYYVNDGGAYVGYDDDTYINDRSCRQVMVIGFCNDIAKSVATVDGSGNVTKVAPNYAAVQMQSGTLNVEVATSSAYVSNRPQGSFYQYFGTWQTSCIYITGGTMNVNTTGEIATVNPAVLPAVAAGDTNSNSAKYGESACIFSESDNPNGGGTLNIEKLASATSYNGSVISVSGGTVNMHEADIIKKATLSHADDPFALADVAGGGDSGSEFPSDRQYRDAALFINGGTLNIEGSEGNALRAGGTVVEVTKNIPDSAAYHTTIGILSRGRTGTESKFTGSNLDITMQGGFSYGIFGTRGTVDLINSSITLTSDSYSYGIYAVNKTNVEKDMVNISLTNTNITIGKPETYEGSGPDNTVWVNAAGNTFSEFTNGAMRAASIGVYLDSHEFKGESGDGGSVTMDNSSIISQEMGVAVYVGSLTFKNKSGISAYNASAIALNDGNIVFEGNSSADEYIIESYINRAGKEIDGCSVDDTNATTKANYADAPGTHQYKIYLPYQRVTGADGNVSITEYENNNGIRVMGGSLIANGKLTVKFRGLYNDYNMFTPAGDNYNKVVVKSFAVACIEDAANGKAASIQLDYADITSSVGGGVKVQGGTITLGKSGGDNSDVTVETTGKTHLYSLYRGASVETADTWKFRPSLSGGFAIISRGGSLTANCGTYTAAYANAAAVTADDIEAPPKITINGGVFTGNLDHDGEVNEKISVGGPMSHYGLMVMGVSIVEINGGKFNGKNGGLFVRGTSISKKAKVCIEAGIFGPQSQADIQDDNYGQDGINLSDFTDAYFGTDANDKYKSEEARQKALKVGSRYFPIAINSLFGGNKILTDDYKGNVNVYIYYGSFTSLALSYGGDLGIASVYASKTSFYIYNICGSKAPNPTEYNTRYCMSNTSISCPANFVRDDNGTKKDDNGNIYGTVITVYADKGYYAG